MNTRDVNQLAKHVMDIATGNLNREPETDADKIKKAASALGQLGGLKGGKARANKLTSERHSEIARNAVAKRWSNREANLDSDN